MERRALQIGTAVLVFALLLRLGAKQENLVDKMGKTMLFVSTGRIVTETISTEPTAEASAEQTVQEMAIPVFGQSQEALVQVNGEWNGDKLALLRSPLYWDLLSDKPTVLILHTHATESYENTENYTETSPYRTLDEDHNMLCVGQAVADILEEGGVHVIHDRTLHDYPVYNAFS